MNQRPNILMIIADQHRWDCLGVAGNKQIQTPHLDQLAGQGVLYENTFCTAPICTPSRYSLFSGLHVHQHLGWTNHCTLSPGIETFPRILKNEGYRTKAIGKMHFAPTYLDIGFEEMELAEQAGQGRYEDDYHRDLLRKGKIDELDWIDQVKDLRTQAPKWYWDSYGAVESNLSEEDFSTTWIGEKALQSINQWGEDSNFLTVSFIKPHHPFDPPKPWSEQYSPKDLALLPGWMENCSPIDLAMSRGFFPHDKLSKETLQKVMAYYYGSISHIDSYVGKFVSLLQKKKRYDNTLIVYVSDHGEYLGFRHLLGKGNYMYDPVVKVPLIIKYPEQKRKGTRSDSLVSLVDLPVTILKQTHCSPASAMKGKDLSSEFDQKYIFAELNGGSEYMIRSKTHKLLLCRDKETQFFDLINDPLETKNLFNEKSTQLLIEEFRNRLAQWMFFEATPPVVLDHKASQIAKILSDENKSVSNEHVKEWFHQKITKQIHSASQP
jgi:arylsulfatase